jgi:hypothetical protein
MLMFHQSNRILLPELKSFQIPLAGETIKDGERSSENGLYPLKITSRSFNWTKSPITSLYSSSSFKQYQ